jgi:hypothetical protein
MEEFKKILALQHEIDQKLDEFITRTKAILQSERAKGHERIIVELEGELYELTKQNVFWVAEYDGDHRRGDQEH